MWIQLLNALGGIYGKENNDENIRRNVGAYHAKQAALLLFADSFHDE